MSDRLSPRLPLLSCAEVRNDSSVWFVFLPVAPLSSAAAVIPGLAAVTITLALLSSVLLSHLLCFHIYLSKRQHAHLSISLPICVLACLSVFTRLFVVTEFETQSSVLWTCLSVVDLCLMCSVE